MDFREQAHGRRCKEGLPPHFRSHVLRDKSHSLSLSLFICEMGIKTLHLLCRIAASTAEVTDALGWETDDPPEATGFRLPISLESIADGQGGRELSSNIWQAKASPAQFYLHIKVNHR